MISVNNTMNLFLKYAGVLALSNSFFVPTYAMNVDKKENEARCVYAWGHAIEETKDAISQLQAKLADVTDNGEKKNLKKQIHQQRVRMSTQKEAFECCVKFGFELSLTQYFNFY